MLYPFACENVHHHLIFLLLYKCKYYKCENSACLNNINVYINVVPYNYIMLLITKLNMDVYEFYSFLNETSVDSTVATM